MLFNGLDLTPYLKIKAISGRGISQTELAMLEVPGMNGAHLQRKRRPPRPLEIEADIRANNPEELRIKMDELNGILAVDEPVPIVFLDEPNITYYGIPESTGENDEFPFMHQGQLTIICPDPYKYGPELTADIPSDTVTLTNEGTADADPIFEMEVLAPVTFAMIQNQNNEYMMIGQPVDVDATVPFQRFERIFNSSGSSLVGWTDATAVDGGSVAGTMETNGTRFQAADYGTGTSWHGPAIKTSLSEVLTDFRLETTIGFWNKQPDEVGRVEIYLLDVNGNQVAKVAMKDTQSGHALAVGEARAGEVNNGHFLIKEYGDSPGNWNNFFGVLRIQREGNQWYAYFAKVDQSTGKHHTRRTVTWSDNEGLYTRTVAQVVVHVARHGTHTSGAMGVYSVEVFKINQESTGIPYIADAGDIITFDHQSEDLLINGESRTDLKDFGGSYFKLQKGENQLVTLPSGSFNTSIKYRERYK
ncbi:distal tail protein Dit [Salinibacillus xinjiangensis]|uniref:Phage tail family protein n=1 Tax=Salinibacillus xinjiangensis TaxID=1229268 RepID=A0A6G1X7V1_9BACI|nr:distal tail protein Dit [Salinibacillus xinjiangensis]MRG87009.1 hypothetical protein [Salinibacillus xinjiangensis]